MSAAYTRDTPICLSRAAFEKLARSGRKVPAKLSAIADAVRCAEQIMKVIDDRWPCSMRHMLGGALMAP